MKYFIDTEFIEGFHKPLFGKRRHFIDMISIAIVAEDGREYYAISTDFNPKDASQWVKDNVISKLPDRHVDFYDSPSSKSEARLWKSNNKIAKEIIEFINPKVGTEGYTGWIDKHNPIADGSSSHGWAQPEFYAYYADYDWVLFCSLFGTMMDLPKGFPMYCKDIKQILDDKVSKWTKGGTPAQLAEYKKECERLGGMYSIIFNNNFNDLLNEVKAHKFYPKEIDEHNALSDAKWNKQLYEFINLWL